jgi:hypothetical protein
MNQNIQKLLEKIQTKNTPFSVRIQIEEFSKTEFCIPNVREKIRRDGGTIVFGWLINEKPFLIEAIYHAVWKSNSGKIIDITQHEVNVEQILFVVDNKSVYKDKQIDNIRINLTLNKLVDDLIALAETRFKILNYRERAFVSGQEIMITHKESQILNEIDRMKENITAMIVHGATRNSMCYCGSYNKYKHCHGKKLIERINSILGY